MGDTAKNPLEKPWHVRVTGPTSGSGFHSGCETEAEAVALCAHVNAIAEECGYSHRYEVVPLAVAK